MQHAACIKNWCCAIINYGGAVMYGDTLDGAWYFPDDARRHRCYRDYVSSILFGQMHIGDSGLGGASSVVNMADTAEICGCNGVCKGAIVKAIVEKKLFTLGRSARPHQGIQFVWLLHRAVESLLASTVGGDYSIKPSKKPSAPVPI